MTKDELVKCDRDELVRLAEQWWRAIQESTATSEKLSQALAEAQSEAHAWQLRFDALLGRARVLDSRFSAQEIAYAQLNTKETNP